jgi:hypothetical protein
LGIGSLPLVCSAPWRKKTSRSRTLIRRPLPFRRPLIAASDIRPAPDAPYVEIVYRRPPSEITRHRQELLLDGETYKITLQHGGDVGPEPAAGAALLWFTFPEREHEVAAVYEPDGRLRGYYTNIVLPPDLGRSGVWHVTDAFLDLWQPRRGDVKLLDREELDEAERAGRIAAADARRSRTEAGRLVEAARKRK